MADNDLKIVDVKRTRADYIKEQVSYHTKLGIDDPLLIVDIDKVVERYRKWYNLFPRVELFYALKCNSNEKIIDVLVKLGSSFDCASKSEIQQVLELGIDPSRIIYANPCKQNSHLTYAKEHNVDLMTFDSEEELIKIKMLYGSARLVLRFRTKHSFKVTYDLGQKFGCLFEEAKDLFISAKTKGLDIVGVCFHVGSNCRNANAYSSSIKEARMIFDVGLQVGFDMKILDIGGGYRGRDVDHPTIEENAEVINQCLDEYFPETDGVTIIAEPGRYLVETAVSAAASIIGRKFVYDNDRTSLEHVMYNVNNGVYGTFHWAKGRDAILITPVLGKAQSENHTSTVWGPTCCATDCVAIDIPLPLMEVGEWVHVHYTGAYSLSFTTSFNSMPSPKLYYFCSRDTWESLQQLKDH
ncbi:ornithine decarboxylase-like [Mizuhopecten yessoensis]|uniref:ornithine decarboxylase n=1 Tax=Mizuhopecten yessoensis TaxID=6573 RepID=A0A210QIQ9_MIZYE|nr:ornithine decarboxylase-like [Mizuhopecten yessoensis]OWF48665.1 Ornithine decarboxylase [Mizuhopecten yessoensis]